jgi:exopolysaccharide biosynthesis protein
MVFKEGVYPHHMIGVREDGKVLSVVVRGLSNRVGLTVLGAAAIMRQLGARDAVLIDNGRDVCMGYRREMVLGSLDGARDCLRSMILFVGPKKDSRSGHALLEFPQRYPVE